MPVEVQDLTEVVAEDVEPGLAAMTAVVRDEVQVEVRAHCDHDQVEDSNTITESRKYQKI